MSLAPRSTAQARLIDEQLTIARQGSWSASFVLPVGAVVLALAESAWVPLWRLVLWCGIIVIAMAGFEIAYRTLEERCDQSPAGGGKRARAIATMTFLQSVAW